MASVPRRLSSWLEFCGLGVTESGGGYVISWRGGDWQAARVLLVRVVLLLYGVVFIASLPGFSLWGPFATIDEQLQYYQVARNYNQYGFLTNYLLPDLSTASSSNHHPYIYNHQPPGPQLLIGVLIGMFGERYVLVRMVFAVIFFVGLWYFVCFVKQLPARGLYLPEMALLFLRPDTVMHSIDHPAYSAFPLCAFFPIVALQRYRMSGRVAWLLAAGVVTFLGANYLIYGPLIMVFAMWTIGCALGLVPIARRDLLLLYAVALLGFLLHLSQTVLLVGWSVFVKEFLYTLSNRMIGVPTRSELAHFFQSQGFVLYGEHAFQPNRLRAVVWQALSFPGRQGWAVVLALLGCVGLVIESQIRLNAREWVVGRTLVEWSSVVSRAGIWTGLSVVTPVLMFPAFSSDYLLGGTNEFLLAVFCVLSLGATVEFVRQMATSRTVRQLAAVLCVAGVAWIGLAQVVAVGNAVSVVGQWVLRERPESALFRIQDDVGGRVAMTNVDPTVIGFFTREAAFGGCQWASVFEAKIDVSKCFVNVIRGYPSAWTRPPTVYVWFREGNPFCSRPARCVTREDLERQYRKIFANQLFGVFDLQEKATPAKDDLMTEQNARRGR